jgi:hypothetical protein
MTNPKFSKAISASSLPVILTMHQLIVARSLYSTSLHVFRRPDCSHSLSENKSGPFVSLPAFEPMGGMIEISRFADIVSSDEDLKLFGAVTNFAAPATAMELSCGLQHPVSGSG